MSPGHHHHSDHHHSHGQHSSENLSERDKLMKMLEHWIRHNEDHARSFREWADRARGLGRADVAKVLGEVADGAHLQNKSLEKALAMLADTQ